jgi:hypothetical protein
MAQTMKSSILFSPLNLLLSANVRAPNIIPKSKLDVVVECMTAGRCMVSDWLGGGVGTLDLPCRPQIGREPHGR